MDFLSLRFTGNGVAPNNTRCKDLAAVITAVEALVSSMIEEASEEPDVSLYLTKIEDESVGLKFTAIQMALAMAAWQNFAEMVNRRDYGEMNCRTRDRLSEILSFVRKKGCRALIGDSRLGVTASFDGTLVLPVEAKFKGKTSLIGEVIGVGGKDPKVRLKLASGNVLSCETSESIAKELGHRLYDLITCRGTATWDFTSGEILKFHIVEVCRFKKIQASQAFKRLADVMPDTIESLRNGGALRMLEEVEA